MTGTRTLRQQAAETLQAELDELNTLSSRISTLLLLDPDATSAINKNKATFDMEIALATRIIRDFTDHPQGQVEFSSAEKANIPTALGTLQKQKEFYTSIANRSRVISEINAVNTKKLAPKALSALNKIALANEKKPEDIRQAIITSKTLLGEKTLLGIKLPEKTLDAFINSEDCKAVHQAAATRLEPLEKLISQKACQAFSDAAKRTDLKTLLAFEKLTSEQAIRSFIADNRILFDLETIDQDTLKSPLVISSATLTTLHKETTEKQIGAAIKNTVFAAIKKLEDGDALREIAEAKDNSTLLKYWDKLGLSSWDFKTLDNFITQPVLATFKAAAANHPKKSLPKATATSAEEKSSTPPPKQKKDELPRTYLIKKISSYMFQLQEAHKAYEKLDPTFSGNAAKKANETELADGVNYMTSAVENTAPIPEAEEKNVDAICAALNKSTEIYISKSNSIYLFQKIDEIKDPNDSALNAIAKARTKRDINTAITTHNALKGSSLKFDDTTTFLILREEEAKIVILQAQEKLEKLQLALDTTPIAPKPKISETPIPTTAARETKTDAAASSTPSTATTSTTTVSETKASTTPATSEIKTEASSTPLRTPIPTTLTPATPGATADAKATTTGTPKKDINAEIKTTLRTIADKINLSDAKEIKAVVGLVTTNSNDPDLIREKIVPLKDKFDVLKNIKAEELESKGSGKIISDDNAKAIQATVLKRIQPLVERQCETAIKALGPNALNGLLNFGTIDRSDFDGIRKFINDSRAGLAGLQHFPDRALENKSVFVNPSAIYDVASTHTRKLGQQVIDEAKTAIQNQKLTEEKEATALADLAAAWRSPENTRTALIKHKDRLGNSFNKLSDVNIKNANIVLDDDAVKALRETARDAIQAQIKQTVTAKIEALKLTIPADKEILDTIAEAKDDDATQKALIKYKPQLGLSHLHNDNHINNQDIIPIPLLRSFKNLAATQRIPKTPEEQIVAEAIAKLQGELNGADPISPAYKNLKGTLLSDPNAKTALLALANHRSTAATDAAARADKLAGILRPHLKLDTTSETDISIALTAAQGTTPVAGADKIAKAIAAANHAEAAAQKVKRLHTELVETDKTITGWIAEAAELHRKAKAAADALPPGTPKTEKTAKAAEAEKACDTLIAKQAKIAKALSEVEKELKSIEAPGAGIAAPATALAKAQAAFDPHKTAETEAKAELDKAKAAYTATQPKATEPELLGISDAVTRAARGQDANSNAIWELNSCKRLKELYTGLYFLKHAAENFGNANAFERLDSAIKSIATLTLRIDELKKSKHPGAGGGTPMSPETQAQLEIMKVEFQALQAEMIRIRDTRKALPRESIERMIQIFSSRGQQFDSAETKMIQKDSASFAAWSSAVQGYAITNYARPAMHARFGDLYSPQLVQQQAYTTDTWRVYPPDPAKVKSSDMIYFEHEYKQTGATESNFEIVVMDLPQCVSDKGLFIQFLLEINKTPAAKLAPGTPIHDLVFKNIPPVLAADAPPVIDEKTAYKLLQSGEIGTGWSRDTTLAKDFMKYLHEHQNKLESLHNDYQDFRNPGASITRAQFLEKSDEERKNYLPQGIPIAEISMPNAVFFEQAAKILSVLVARGYSPMTITDAESEPLLLAMDCLAQKYGIRDTLNFPSSYKRAVTPEQIEIAKVKNYKIPALDVVDKTLAATAAAATAGHAADIGTYISKPRRGP